MLLILISFVMSMPRTVNTYACWNLSADAITYSEIPINSFTTLDRVQKMKHVVRRGCTPLSTICAVLGRDHLRGFTKASLICFINRNAKPAF